MVDSCYGRSLAGRGTIVKPSDDLDTSIWIIHEGGISFSSFVMHGVSHCRNLSPRQATMPLGTRYSNAILTSK
jgi:hypothetical protein